MWELQTSKNSRFFLPQPVYTHWQSTNELTEWLAIYDPVAL